jgi:hypothetical protein
MQIMRIQRRNGLVEVPIRITWADQTESSLLFGFAGNLPDLRLDSLALTEEGIVPTRLQRFAWARWLTVADAAARRHLAAGSRRPFVAGREPLKKAVDIAMGATQPPRRKGPVPRPDSFYAEIASRYLELRADGEKAPTQRLAGERGYNRSTMAGLIREARKRELLPPAARGKAS